MVAIESKLLHLLLTTMVVALITNRNELAALEPPIVADCQAKTNNATVCSDQNLDYTLNSKVGNLDCNETQFGCRCELYLDTMVLSGCIDHCYPNFCYKDLKEKCVRSLEARQLGSIRLQVEANTTISTQVKTMTSQAVGLDQLNWIQTWAVWTLDVIKHILGRLANVYTLMAFLILLSWWTIIQITLLPEYQLE